ncbi:hypothetical protein ACXZ9C_10500 [Streptococcus agalactiae]
MAASRGVAWSSRSRAALVVAWRCVAWRGVASVASAWRSLA